jgi:hypothetical protein
MAMGGKAQSFRQAISRTNDSVTYYTVNMHALLKQITLGNTIIYGLLADSTALADSMVVARSLEKGDTGTYFRNRGNFFNDTGVVQTRDNFPLYLGANGLRNWHIMIKPDGELFLGQTVSLGNTPTGGPYDVTIQGGLSYSRGYGTPALGKVLANVNGAGGGVQWTSLDSSYISTFYASVHSLFSATSPIVYDGKGGFTLSGTYANSVSNSDGSLTISPTTGSVIASIALGHSNAFTARQTVTIAATAANDAGEFYADRGTATSGNPVFYETFRTGETSGGYGIKLGYGTRATGTPAYNTVFGIGADRTIIGTNATGAMIIDNFGNIQMGPSLDYTNTLNTGVTINDGINFGVSQAFHTTTTASIYFTNGITGGSSKDLAIQPRNVSGGEVGILNTGATDEVLITDDAFVQCKQPLKVTHIIGNSSAPTIAAGTGAGTSPTISISGTDAGGFISLTTGTSPSASATVFTVTFNVAYGAAPKSVVLTPGGPNTATLSGNAAVYADEASTSTTQFIAKVGSTNLTAATTYIWYYHVIQ